MASAIISIDLEAETKFYFDFNLSFLLKMSITSKKNIANAKQNYSENSKFCRIYRDSAKRKRKTRRKDFEEIPRIPE